MCKMDFNVHLKLMNVISFYFLLQVVDSSVINYCFFVLLFAFPLYEIKILETQETLIVFYVYIYFVIISIVPY